MRAATLASSALTEGTWVSNISIEAYTPKPQEDMDAHRRGVASDYFLTEGMMLLAGRPIGPQDTAASPRVINSAPVNTITSPISGPSN